MLASTWIFLGLTDLYLFLFLKSIPGSQYLKTINIRLIYLSTTSDLSIKPARIANFMPSFSDVCGLKSIEWLSVHLQKANENTNQRSHRVWVSSTFYGESENILIFLI